MSSAYAGAAVLVSDFVLGVDSVEVDEPESEVLLVLESALVDFFPFPRLSVL